MKVFISADIEGVNSIHHWDETSAGNPRYSEFKKQMTDEVRMACIGAYLAGAKTIYVKDAHDSAMNLSIQDLPEYITLHRGWEGNLCSMMAGLDDTFDAVLFVGYHSPSRSDGNTLSHTMSTRIVHVKLNGRIISEFDINAMYATTKGVPIAFLSGDFNLTKLVKNTNPHIHVVATKIGQFGATVSKHPSITNEEIKKTVLESLTKKDLYKSKVALPEMFDVEIQYRSCAHAHSASFYPGCTLVKPDRIAFKSDDYTEVLRMFHFNL